MDRVHVRTDPLGHTDTYTYDPDGQVATYLDRRGAKTVYTYDALERRATATYGVTTTSTESTVTYGYDPADRVTSVADSKAGTITTSFNDLANTVTATDPTGTLTDSYDNAGRLVKASASGLPDTTYGYDDANELKTVARGSQQVAYSYDDAGRQVSRQLPGGVTITPTYSDAGVLQTLTYANSSGALGDLRYAVDADDQRIAVTGSWARTNLPAAETGENYDADDRLTAVAGHTLSYDDAGNLTSDGTNNYTWNARGQLTTVTQPGGTTTLGYDAGNRLASITSGGATTSYRYAGTGILTRTQTDSTTASYLNGLGADAPLTMTSTAGGTQDLLPDALGSTLAVTDPTGNPTTNYTYDPFGTASSDNPTDTNPLRYAARPSSPDLPAGLQDNRARDYSPVLHRFLSADPVGHASGQTDPYTYAAADPADNTDPSGNWVQYAAACAIGAGYETLAGVLTGRKHSWGDFLGGALNGCVQGTLMVTPFGAEEDLGAAGADAALETAPEDEAALADSCEIGNSFTGDTPVEMADGASKPISQVKIGDQVLATDPTTGATTARTVTALIHHHGPHTMVRIAMTGGGSLRATDHHPFWNATTHHWTDAADLHPGDQLREPDGTLTTVTAATTYTANLTAYNLTVASTHSYYVVAGATPVLVHNSSGVTLLGTYRGIKKYISANPGCGFDADFLNIRGTMANGKKGVGGWNWTRNKRFIDDALENGDEIRLVVDPDVPLYSGGNVYQRELKYLQDKGYGWVQEGDYWRVVRVRP